jgi:hypothetical protein
MEVNVHLCAQTAGFQRLQLVSTRAGRDNHSADRAELFLSSRGPPVYVLVEWEEGKSTPDRQAGALYWVPGRSICVHCPLNWLYGLLLSCRVVRIYGRKS